MDTGQHKIMSGETSSTLQINGVEAQYGSKFSLGPLQIALPVGVTCLIGENGAGKTTLMNCLAGVSSAHVTAPSFVLGEKTVPRAQLTVGFMPQESVLPRMARCEDYLYYVAWLQKIESAQQVQAVARSLQAVNLEDKTHSRIRTLSGGMKRRLLLAAAVIGQPDLVLLDEPTVGLDPHQRADMLRFITAVGYDSHVLLSTHLLEDVLETATQILLLRSGQLVYEGTLDNLDTCDEVPTRTSSEDCDSEEPVDFRHAIECWMACKKKGE